MRSRKGRLTTVKPHTVARSEKNRKNRILPGDGNVSGNYMGEKLMKTKSNNKERC